MKREISHNFIKHVVVGIFTLVVFVIGACILPSEGSEALAAEAYTADSYAGTEVSSTYWTKTAPEPKDTKYAGWLFAGWMDTEGNVATSIDTSATYYAKFVDPEVLSVKVQVTDGVTATSEHERANMRLVSSIDSLDYNGAGFEVYYDNDVDDYGEAVETVYKRIEAGSTSGVAFKYSPKVIDTDSEHFMTYTLLGIKRGNFEKVFHIRPYWITKDGLKIHGVSRFVKVSDSYSNVTNIPVYADSVEVVNGYESATVGITSGEAAIAGVSVAQDGYYYDSATQWANLRVTITGADALPSASTISATIGDNTYKVIYRNLEKEYVGTAESYVVGDQTWYSEYILNNPGETAFVIATTTDLYGLPDLVNKDGITFSGKSIYVVADIAGNDDISYKNGTATSGNPELTSSTDYRWTAIGDGTTQFGGVFNGQGHTISGLYINDKPKYCGFFGTTDDAIIKDFSLITSVFRSSLGNSDSKFTNGTYVGGVIAFGDGAISEVYTDAIIVGYYYMGGLIGGVNRHENDNSDDCVVTIKNCQYDGLVYNRITSTDTYTSGDTIVTRSDCNARSGGIIGYLPRGTVRIEETLFSGSIRVSAGANRFGGFVGDTNSTSTLKELTISNSVSAGEITLISSTATSSCIASVIGRVHASGNISLDNVYATNECYEISCAVNGSDTLNLVDGKDATKVSYSDLIGLSAYHKISLDFVNDWAPVEGALIAPRAIAQNPYIITENETKADTSWYTKDKTEYEIKNADELYGLAILVNDGEDFEGITVKLTSNINLNEGWNGELKIVNGGPVAPEEPVNEWIPIGTSANMFKGTFEGNGKVISGLYIDKQIADSNGIGLFGNVYNVQDETQMCTIQNFAIDNSYIYTRDNTSSYIGGLVGKGEASIDNVYCDVDIYGVNSSGIGGIIGSISGGTKANTLCTIQKCWYDGVITLRTGSAMQVNTGGFVGYILHGVNNAIEHCLFTGEINYNNASAAAELKPRLGGFIGRNNSTTGYISISDSLSAGSITCTTANEAAEIKEVGSVLGAERGTSSGVATCLKISNVYVSTDYTVPAVVGSSSTELTEFKDSTGISTTIISVEDWDGAIGSLDSEYWAPTETIPVLRNLTQYTTYQVLP